mmetsp:Transcript_8558/g.20332  ORF Transcript_8558/g.20332 Transcript_8558/m.20332 type:complete len:202 (-) Transcript_8558:21-626(-)
MALWKQGKRQESEATRRRRAAWARYRQGLNGKWESNAKKALARRVKQKCLRIGPMLAQTKAAADARAAQDLKKARKLVQALKHADEEALRKLLPELKALPVTSSLLRRTLIPKVLRESAAKFPDMKLKVMPIVGKWRKIYVEDKKKQAQDKKAPKDEKGPQARRSPAASLPIEEPEVEVLPTRRPPKMPSKQRRITFFMKS